ncbi:hypothetical protein ROSA5918_11300 [Roseateles saccharophilus]|uniref:Uncharacterized protein n=2 Tax=Roseateles saccharophilus TaxID=304 RepID=A0A4R3UQ99_ROSSA|nr:hypothetical protein EV671_102221 [Roseateles saccharophilus]
MIDYGTSLAWAGRSDVSPVGPMLTPDAWCRVDLQGGVAQLHVQALDAGLGGRRGTCSFDYVERLYVAVLTM